MEKVVCYKRDGKFGKPEYLIPLKKCLPLIQKKETEKAYCCGEYTGYTYKDGNPQLHIFGFIPKSMLVKIEDEEFVPTWIIVKFQCAELQFTQWINKEYWRVDGHWEVKEFIDTKDESSEFYNRILNGKETPQDIEKFNGMCMSYSDIYKDMYGIRPRDEMSMCVNGYSGNPDINKFRELLKQGINPLKTVYGK